MGYLNSCEIKELGLNSVGREVQISGLSSIYNTKLIDVGEGSRIDDFCVLSGPIKIGRNVHIAPHCIISAGTKPIIIEDFATIGYRTTVISRSDDYTHSQMSGPLNKVANEKAVISVDIPVIIHRNVVIGAHCVVLPGAKINENASVGAFSLVKGELPKNYLSYGVPAAPRKINFRATIL